MASTLTSARRPVDRLAVLRPAAVPVAIAGGAFAGGVALGLVGRMAGPIAMVAIPVAVLAAAAVLSRPLLGVLGVFASFPVGFAALPLGALDIKLVEAVAALVVGLVALRRLTTGATPLPWTPQMWWGLLFVAWALLATPSAVSVSEAAKQDGLLIVGFLFALAVLATIRSFVHMRIALGVLLVVATGICASGLQGASKLQARFGGSVVDNRIQGVFAQPNDLGAFAAIVLPVAIGMAFGGRTRWSRRGAAAAAVFAVLALVLSLSRGGWIGTAFAGLLMIAVLPRARRAAFAVGMPLLVGGALILGVLLPSPPPQVEVVKERIGSFAHPESNPYDDRPTIWKEALREIRSDPLTGHGPGNFPVASTRGASLAQTVQADHAHDVLLTVGAEVGLPGVGLLAGFTLAVAFLVLRLIRRLGEGRDAAIVVGVACGMAADVGQGLVDFNLRNAVIFFLMWSLLGVLLAANRIAGGARVPGRTRALMRMAEGRLRPAEPAS